MPVTTASPVSTAASVVTYSSSSTLSSSNVPTSSPVVVSTNHVGADDRELITQNNAPLPSSMPSSCHSAIVANSRHVNTIHSTVFVSQHQSVVVREGGGGELRSPENIHNLKPASAIVINSSQNNSVPPRVSSISQPVIVTSSPGLNSHPSHISNNSSVSDSYSIPPKVNMLSNHPYDRPSPSTISTQHHVIKSPTNYSTSSHGQGLSLSVRDQNQDPSVYSSPYGPNQNRAVVTQQSSLMYKASGPNTPGVALSPPNSVLSIGRQDSSPHMGHAQSDHQPMDLGCRSANSRIGVHARSLSPPSQHCQTQQQSHYGAIASTQQQSVVNYRSRSPSPSAYRVQHIQHSVHSEHVQPSRTVHMSPSPQGSSSQSGQYSSSAFRHHLSPSKVYTQMQKLAPSILTNLSHCRKYFASNSII